MKKKIFKLIALSLLPMTLMSFKGNEPSEIIDGNKTVGQIKKAGAENTLRKDWGNYIWDSQNNKVQAYNGNLFSMDVDFQPTEENNFNYVYLYIPLFSVLESPDGSLAESEQGFSLGTYQMQLLPEGGAEPVYSNKLFNIVDGGGQYQDGKFWHIDPQYSKYVSFYGNVDEASDMSQNCGLKIDITAFYKEILHSDYFNIESKDRPGLTVVFGANHPETPNESKYIADEDGNRIDYGSLPSPYFEGEFHLNSGEKKDVYVNVDNPTTLDQIKSGVHAKDLFGADVPVEYAVKDGSKEYDPSKLGTYSYTITAKAYGQTATATLNIIVKDVTAPTISNTTPVSVPYSQGLKLSDLDGKFAASDNATDKGGTIDPLQYFVGDAQIDNDHPYTISVDQAKKGKLTLTVKATDSSGNTGSADFDVTITDDKAPEIMSGGKAVIEGTKFPTSLKLFKNADAAKSAFLAGFTAQDEIDSDAPSVEVVNFPTLDNVKVGDNEVTLSAVDHAGNRKNVNVIVEVTNDELPVFVFDSFLVSATSDNPLTADQLTTLVSAHLYSTLNVVVNKEDIRVASSDYEQSARIPGKYSVQYTYKQADGTFSDAQSFDVMVSGAKETSWWDDFIRALSDFFQRLWNWLCGRGWKTNAEIHDEEILSSGKDA